MSDIERRQDEAIAKAGADALQAVGVRSAKVRDDRVEIAPIDAMLIAQRLSVAE